MRIQIPLVSVGLASICLIPSVIGVYVDEAYHIDYHQQLLGLPQQHATFFHRPRKDEKASLLYTLSDQGVLGAVNPGTGVIVWRQLLVADSNRTVRTENGIQGYLRAAEGEGTLVSAIEGHLHAWDALTGREKWNNYFEGSAKDLEVMETVGNEAYKDALVLFEHLGKGIVRRLDGSTGNVVWEYLLDGADVPFQVSTNVKNVFVVSLHGARGGYNLRITTLDPATGKRVDQHTLASKSDVHGPEDVIFVGANVAAPIVAWNDKSATSLKVNILGTKQIHNLHITTGNEEIEHVVIHAPHLIQSQPHFLVHSRSANSHWAEVYHIDIVAGTITEAYHLPKLPGNGAFSTSSQEANVYFTRHTKDEVIVVSSASHGVLGKWPLALEADIGSAVHAVSEVVRKTAKSYAVRSAVVSTEDNWDMIRNGVPAWQRTEGLSGAVAASWAEIPEEEELAKTLEAEAHSSPLAAYIHRVRRHINDLQYLPEYLRSLPKQFFSSVIPGDGNKSHNEPLARDSFGFRKLVILATERGRLYGLDTLQGKIIWSRKAYSIPADERWDVKGILVNNTKGTAIVKSADGGEITFKTASGASLNTVPRGSQPPIRSTAVVDSPSGQVLLSIGLDGIPLSQDVLPSKHGIVVTGENGGLKLLISTEKNNEVSHIETWTFQAPKGQRILSATSRPARDPVASIGRVMSDRSVMYKYLNPNIILVTAVSDAASTASFYLLDSVSGAVLHSTTQESVDLNQPITTLLTENWFVYSLWSETTKATYSSPQSFKGYQIFVSELYESSLTNDRGPLGASANYSSLEPSDEPSDEAPLPYVISQVFLIPEPISHMSVTQTRQGITSRQILCTLASSHSIVGIHRGLLDPRRPVGRDPTPGELEEGLSKYNPVIEFDPKMIITHQREVYGIRNVITSPALLESTSLVFAYGVDIFGTRVTPSQAFDLLGKDFNRLTLVASVAALTLGVGVLAPMVRTKQINGRWKTS